MFVVYLPGAHMLFPSEMSARAFRRDVARVIPLFRRERVPADIAHDGIVSFALVYGARVVERDRDRDRGRFPFLAVEG